MTSWGHLDAPPHRVVALRSPADAAQDMHAGGAIGLPYGVGRSYGDECLNPGGTLWQTTGLDHFIAFDDATGCIECEAGVLLRDIQELAVPRGWMLPVTPGTQFVTVGGAIANDVHGKNHHVRGSFSDHVMSMRLVRTDGEVVDCGPRVNAGWFTATAGGMGLTGLITQAKLQLHRVCGPWLETETIPFAGQDAFFELADGSEAQWEHTVAWIDCLSDSARGLFMRGRPAQGQEGTPPRIKPLRVPFEPPVSLVNRHSLRAFNAAYFHLNRWRAGKRVEHYVRFLHPLDHIGDWNRMYGKRGFFQYQCVLPVRSRAQALQSLLAEIRRSRDGSFLAVLKTFGARESVGMMSFPMPGVTLALDFPNHGEASHALFARLDAVVREAAGRIYLAKDARMPRELFEAGYPRLGEFLPYRDPGISSAMSRRLMGS